MQLGVVLNSTGYSADMDDMREALADVSARLAATDELRAQQIAERDALIRQAREQQVPWVEIQRLTGLTPAAVAKAIKRS